MTKRTIVIAALAALGAQMAIADGNDAEQMGAEGMNPDATLACLERSAGGAFRVLVYGNSIALHTPKPDIGWTGEWGMAASASEKDFAHLVVAGLESRRGEQADFRIRNLALLERNYTTNLAEFAELAADISWAPDYVVIAIGENVPAIDAASAPAYTQFLVSLARPLAESASHPVVVMRSPFWRNDAKAACTASAALEIGAAYVDAGPLGDDAANKAIGQFEHTGVANHPGDLGMRRLADLILGAIHGGSVSNGSCIVSGDPESDPPESSIASAGVPLASGPSSRRGAGGALDARFRTSLSSAETRLRSDANAGSAIILM